jgi:DTW domain-containing protein YfiP
MVLKDAMGEIPDACATCGRPPGLCVCDRTTSLGTHRRVLVLQHPQEKDVLLGTASLLALNLAKAKVVVGMSWRSLAHALDEKDADPRRWAVLFPDKKEGRSAAATEPGARVVNRHGDHVSFKKIEGLVALDGSWSQAKTLWWRNPWLLKLNRMSVVTAAPSIYGRLRVEPQQAYVSTLEAVAGALTSCGEDPDVEAQLKKTFRTLVQRARDLGLGPQKRVRRRGPQVP